MEPDPIADVLHALASSDPEAIAVAFDGSSGAFALLGVHWALGFLDRLPGRPRTRVMRWIRRHRIRLRKAVPIAVPLALGVARGVLALATDGDPIMATIRGAGAGLSAVGLNEMRVARAKIEAAPLEAEAPTHGAGQ